MQSKNTGLILLKTDKKLRWVLSPALMSVNKTRDQAVSYKTKRREPNSLHNFILTN